MWTVPALLLLSFCGVHLSSAQSSDCGPEYKDWARFGDSCYHFTGYIGSAYTWHAANQYCRDRGALLASVHSAEENEFLAKDKVWTRLHPAMWLGLNSIEDSASITWLDGTDVDFTRVNVSVIDSTRRCAALDSPDPSRRWLFMHCDTEGSLVCKRPWDSPARTISPPVPTASPGNCPQEWTRVGNKCFKIFSSRDGHRVNHSTARTECLALGAGHDLASLHNHEENLALTTLTANEETNLWIGLSRITFTTFGWTDNTRLDFTNWAPGEPSSVAEGCTEFLTTKLRTGLWNDISCRQMMGYICQRSPDLAISTSRPPQQDCDNEGFVRYGESCYGVFQGDSQVTWSEADRICKNHNGNLASVHSGQEMAFLKRNFINQAEGPLWIGLTTSQGGVYQWSDGWPVKYLDFPSNFKSPANRCTFINSNGTWNTGDCNENRGFLCRVTEEDRPDFPEVDLNPCPAHISPLIDVGLKHCYAIRQYQSWGGANMECIKNDTQLVSFHHQHELELLAPHLINYPKGFWIGQIRKYHGEFDWVDGTKTDFQFWATNEPSTKAKQDCVHLSSTSLKSSTKDCSDSYSFICKVAKG